MEYLSKFPDTFFVLLNAYCSGLDIGLEDLSDQLRKCDYVLEQQNFVQLSEKARKVHNVTKIGRGISKPKGLWLEHIIPVVSRRDLIIKLFSEQNKTSRKFIDEFIEKTFYAVYKLDTEKEQDFEAESLLLEEFKSTDKIKYLKSFYD